MEGLYRILFKSKYIQQLENSIDLMVSNDRVFPDETESTESTESKCLKKGQIRDQLQDIKQYK
jgi:hypothetical protein